MNKEDIRSLTRTQLSEILKEEKTPNYKINQIYDWLWTKGVSSFSEMSNISKDQRDWLDGKFVINSASLKEIYTSTDTTIKVAFQLYDERLVEGVLIPSGERVTACISSQTGCGLGCAFCATANITNFRNLSAGEIFDQFVLLNKLSIESYGVKLTNIVMMGMGEPLLNLENLKRAIFEFTYPKGINFSPRRITVSTVGISKYIKQLADSGLNVNLAVSLHSAIEEKRKTIIPYSKSDSLSKLSEAIKYYYDVTHNRPTIEYLLLNKYNDSIDDAEALAKYCKSFPCKVNLIEYNTTDESKFSKSSSEALKKFKDFLHSKNMVVNLRASRGSDINAACGQLVNKNLNKKAFEK